MSPFKRLQHQSTTFSKGRNVATINHGIGHHGQNIVLNLLCRENILTPKRRRTSSLRITKMCFVECQEYWDNVLQASLSGFRPIHYLMKSRACVQHDWDVL